MLDSSFVKEAALSYLKKACAYLKNLQMAAIFLLLSEESAALSDKGNLVTRGLKNDAEEGMSLSLSEFSFEESAVFTQVHPQWF